MEGMIHRKIEVIGRQCKQLPDDLKATTVYWKLKKHQMHSGELALEEATKPVVKTTK